MCVDCMVSHVRNEIGYRISGRSQQHANGTVSLGCFLPMACLAYACMASMFRNMAGPSPQRNLQAHTESDVSQVAGGVSGQHHTAAEGHRMLLGNACLLANTVAMAVYFITAKQLVMKYPPMCVAAWAYITAAVCMGAAAFIFVDRIDWQLPSIMLGPLVYWVVVCSVIGYYVVTWASQYLPASQVSSAGSVLCFMLQP